jgi:sterol desaturase/sphingolipid hydroxylase (fatty acid hydroxylase superfamily)
MNDVVALTGFSEASLRLGAFLSAFIGFSILEAIFPRRKRLQSRFSRLWTNAGILIAGTLLLRVLAIAAPLIAAASAATYAERWGIGLFNLFDLPILAEIALTVIVFDAAIWLQHLVSHKVPIFWRLHQVHHTDRDLDASSALRFHPLEILISSAFKVGLVFLIGPAAIAVIVFEIILNMSAMFNHANLTLPAWLDRTLKRVIVTPDMHRIHHSVHRHEHDTNYGFFLSIWDRAASTYTRDPNGGQKGMTIGLGTHQASTTDALGWALALPFRPFGKPAGLAEKRSDQT